MAGKYHGGPICSATWLESFQSSSLTAGNIKRGLITTAETSEESAWPHCGRAITLPPAWDLLRAAAKEPENQTAKSVESCSSTLGV